jgi:hypothetical protein
MTGNAALAGMLNVGAARACDDNARQGGPDPGLGSVTAPSISASQQASVSLQAVVISAPCIRLLKSGSQNRPAFLRPAKAGSVPAR